MRSLVTWPASVFQQSMVQLDQLLPGVMTHETETMSIAVRVRGPLDVDLLDRAYDEVVARHELLRTRLERDAGTGDVLQIVEPHQQAHLHLMDPGDDAVAGGPAWPITVAAPPLVRGAVSSAAPDEHRVGLTVHHVIADQSTPALLLKDLAAVYSARQAGEEPAPVPLQHGEFAVWQRQRLAPRAQADRAGWAATLDGIRAPAYERAVPFEPGRPAAPQELRVPLLSAADVDALARWSLRRRSTLFCSLLAAFARTLATTTDDRDLPISSAFEQRDHPAVRDLPGPFLYPTLLRLHVRDGEPWPALVARVREVVTAAYARAQVPVMELASMTPALLPGAMGIEPAWMRLFQYIPRSATAATFAFGPATAEVVASEGTGAHGSEYGAHLRLRHDQDGTLVGRFGYDTNEFDEASATALMAGYHAEIETLTHL